METVKTACWLLVHTSPKAGARAAMMKLINPASSGPMRRWLPFPGLCASVHLGAYCHCCEEIRATSFQVCSNSISISSYTRSHFNATSIDTMAGTDNILDLYKGYVVEELWNAVFTKRPTRTGPLSRK